ncbi:MAG: trypsin-like peptidase domain-containing protein [Acidobacteriota bacterium]
MKKRKIALIPAIFFVVLILFPDSEAFPQAQRRSGIVQVAEKAGPAVVNISTEQKLEDNPFFDSHLRSFFRDFFFEAPQEEYVQNSLGSGVIIDGKGYILTNEHVIMGASRIRISLADKREFFAEVAGTDPSSDLAVLKINATDPLPSIRLGRSDDLMIGETVIAIGNPFGFSNTVTTGVVSALGRKLKARNGERIYSDFIQIDAAINPGNSGGALLNIEGELIGINTAIISEAEGIGFAIPIDRAKKVFYELVSYGEVRPLWLGMEVATLDAELKRYLKTTESKGTVVVKVFSGSPAESTGIRVGDIITRIGNEELDSKEDYDTIISKHNIGDRVVLSISGKGGFRTSALTIGDFPSRRFSFEKLGMEVSSTRSSIFSIVTGSRSKGVVISRIKPGGPADRRGLERGDIIIQIDNNFIDSVEDYNKLLPKLLSRRSIYMLIVRGRYSYRLTMELD